MQISGKLTERYEGHGLGATAQPATHQRIQLNWKLNSRLGTRSHRERDEVLPELHNAQTGSNFAFHNYPTTASKSVEDQVFQYIYTSLQKWYVMDELLERSPTLPQTYQTVAENDGNSPEKLTVNSTRVRETEVDNRENISLSMGI
ncbi:hypothetical protein F511_40631 [Dorcoceras hygrometricum]|uniref:Uncharacterized protein n=1 Tax=Dorcoceras hygrometricum TaxID=472368 RepID=A0A2Z7A5K5_9LAMI|nr:hypothetical protein F511_40631 [Dorcoceras hygrometricum]